MKKPLFTGSEWRLDQLPAIWKAIDKIGKSYGLDYYEPQIEIVTAEQMLDMYSSVGMPFMYNHWSFGKDFLRNEKAYERGEMGLAYELVINTNPSIAYLMETNTITMQAIVLAHAVCGHASFFKCNHLFQQWTNADSIVQYLTFAKEYLRECEKKYGHSEVEELLDMCHSLKYYGVHKYKKPAKKKHEDLLKREMEWLAQSQKNYNAIWDTVPNFDQEALPERSPEGVEFPYDNILYFIEKHSRRLPGWKKEVVRIVRKINEYFYPQMQTKVMNEGWASFWHYRIMTDMYEQGHINEGSYLEFLHQHSSIVFQPDYNSRYFSQINPYTLGFNIFMDMKRICENPTDEDREWFPDICGTDWLTTLTDAMECYRDESFIRQFLSPKVAREMGLFCLWDVEEHPRYEIKHVAEDFIELREALANEYMTNRHIPIIEITGCDFAKTYRLELTYFRENGAELDQATKVKVLSNLRKLWGHPIDFKEEKLD